MECDPAFNYARDEHQTTISTEGARFHAPGLSLGLLTRIPLAPHGSGAQADFVLDHGQTTIFGLRAIPAGGEDGLTLSQEQEFELFRGTVDWWRHRLARCTYKGRWREAVHRSVLALKLLTFEPTGAIVAAPTCSLPEDIGGVRNWDYRYTNVAADSEDGRLQPVYRINGRSGLEEREIDGLPGYRGMGPVRFGNQAYRQIQNDVYGSTVLAATHMFFDERLVYPGNEALFRRLEHLGNMAARLYDRPDAGPWELRGASRVHTYSSVMCWAACDRLSRIARQLGLEERAADWSAVSDRMHRAICEHAWNDEMNSFVATFRLFTEAFDKLLNAVDARCRGTSEPRADRATYSLPTDLEEEVTRTLEDWGVAGKMRRLWVGDASLWTNEDESEWLGWLGLTEESAEYKEQFQQLSQKMRSSRFENVVLLGMGGSSLCPEVLRMTYGTIDGFPALHVLDSTDPAQIRALESKLDLTKSLFIVSSKSGSTLEPNIFKQYFFARVRQAVGNANVGDRFIAITDPGSRLEKVAVRDGFLRIFSGIPSVGGRYSALSNFGMVPGAVMGLDIVDFLERAEVMAVATSSCVPVDQNPGAKLGTVLGVLANRGRDKLTLITSPGVSDLGAWLEQLIAESTGKEGKGIIPVDREIPGPPEVYGDDRLFVYLSLEPALDPSQDEAVTKLERAGHPVLRIPIADIMDLGQEFFRWEIATAVAGSIIGINPFNQPDVEASKIVTRRLTAEYEETGSMPVESPIFEEDGVRLFTDKKNAAALASAIGDDKSLSGYLRAHLNRLGPGDYLALLAYIEMNAAHEKALAAIRHAVRAKKHVATCLGFGPRFLHSTGQAYKGGPSSGVFLQVTCDDREDLPVPGQKYTFGIVKAAQARGDFEVLAERDRRALRVHLGPDVDRDLGKLEKAFREALS